MKIPIRKFFFEAKRGYNALFIELKQANFKLYKKNGELIKDKHIYEQELIHKRLNAKGYLCKFAVGFDKAKQIIDWYMQP